MNWEGLGPTISCLFKGGGGGGGEEARGWEGAAVGWCVSRPFWDGSSISDKIGGGKW